MVRIQPATHANFKHGQFHPRAGKIFESHGGQHFKEAGMPGQRTTFDKIFRRGIYALIDQCEFNVTDLFAAVLEVKI